MGVSKYDPTVGHRRLEDQYAFEYETGVKMLLEELQYIENERFERGDYAATDMLIDLQSAIVDAKLKPLEYGVALDLLVNDLHRDDVAAKYGIAQSSVYRLATSACRKIAAVYRQWGYGGMYVE